MSFTVRYAVLVAVVVAALSILRIETSAQTVPTPVTVCGTLIDYRAPTPTAIGNVIVGGEQFFVSADARVNLSPDAKPGTEVCLAGAWIPHASGRTLVELTLVPRANATPGPGLRYAVHENAALGYRITLPDVYRRWFSSAVPSGAGADGYTRRVAATERDLCTRGLDMDSDVNVMVARTDATPMEYVSAPNARIVFTTVESVTVNGHPAVKVVHQPSGDTAQYVIRANDRLYVIAPAVGAQPSRQPQGWLDQIAASFVAIPATPPATEIRTSPCVTNLPSTTTSVDPVGGAGGVLLVIATCLLLGAATLNRAFRAPGQAWRRGP